MTRQEEYLNAVTEISAVMSTAENRVDFDDAERELCAIEDDYADVVTEMAWARYRHTDALTFCIGEVM